MTNKFQQSHRYFSCFYFCVRFAFLHFQRKKEFNTMNILCLWLVQTLFIHTARRFQTITIILAFFQYFFPNCFSFCLSIHRVHCRANKFLINKKLSQISFFVFCRFNRGGKKLIDFFIGSARFNLNEISLLKLKEPNPKSGEQ